jgi:hypothetical protein
MDINSTPFISYREIDVDDTDLFDDAWGFNSEFADVIEFLGTVEPVMGNQLTDRLIGMIRTQE